MKNWGWIILIISMSSSMLYARSDSDAFNAMEDVEDISQNFLQKIKKLKVKEISDLVYLSLFSNIAVIQRRFMPKTGRLSTSALSIFNLSSEFFFHSGVTGRVGYHFLEKHGVEFSSYYLWSFDREITSSLKKLGISLSEFSPIPHIFLGLTYNWMPTYGKIAFYNQRILAFDIFFNMGFGMSGILYHGNQKTLLWLPAGVLGIGQVFAITRDLGFSLDFRYQITFGYPKLSERKILNHFLLSFGLSQYYPSVGLR